MAAKIIYTRTTSAMNKWGEIFVEKLKTQMKIDKTDASGKTRRSIKQETKETTTHILSDGKGPAATLELIDKGFRPKSPPAGKHLDGIVQWMKDKGVHPKRKGKFVRRTRASYRRAATAIAIGISRRGGIRRFSGGSGILDFTFNRIAPSYEENVMGAYVDDVEAHLNKNTKRVVK